MRTVLFAFTLLFWGFAAIAQPMVVRTGEHDDFTRVVVFFDAGTEWRFEETQSGYKLEIATLRGYDIADFFDLIPQTRIQAVAQRPDNGTLMLTLACPCDAQAKLFRPDIIMIDVSDRKQVDVPEKNAIVPDAEGRIGTFTIPRDQLLSLARSGNRNQIASSLDVVQPAVAPTLEQRPAPTLSTSNDFADQVLRALGEGLSSGSLRVAQGDVAQEPPTSGASLSPNTSIPGVIARSNIDAAVAQVGAEPPQTQTGAICLPDQYFDVRSWGDDRPFGAQISQRRASLAQDREGIDEEQAMLLARNFVYFGFGQEALEVLALSQQQSLSRRALSDVARMLDQRPVEAEFYADQVSCDARVALWALVANGGIDLRSVVARDAILLHFKDLPIVLQSIIAPALSNAFALSGDFDASRQVLARSGGVASNADSTQIAESNLALAIQEPEEAAAILGESISATARPSPELMTQFFEVGVLAGQRFQEDDFALSDAIRFEADNSDTYITLTQAQIRAHIANQDFQKAGDLLFTLNDGNDKAALQDFFAQEAVIHMNDLAFGEFAWSEARLPPSRAARSAIAKRLREMGFPDKASEIEGTLAEQTVADAASFGLVNAASTDLPNSSAQPIAAELPNNLVQPQGIVPSNVPGARADTSLQTSRALLAESASLRQSFNDQFEALSTPVDR